MAEVGHISFKRFVDIYAQKGVTRVASRKRHVVDNEDSQY